MPEQLSEAKWQALARDFARNVMDWTEGTAGRGPDQTEVALAWFGLEVREPDVGWGVSILISFCDRWRPWENRGQAFMLLDRIADTHRHVYTISRLPQAKLFLVSIRPGLGDPIFHGTHRECAEAICLAVRDWYTKGGRDHQRP